MEKQTPIVVSCDSDFYRGRPVAYEENVEFSTSAESYGSHIAHSRHLLSFLFTVQAEFSNINVAAYSDTGAVVDITTTKNGVQVIQ